jgi:hypothetical protein
MMIMHGTIYMPSRVHRAPELVLQRAADGRMMVWRAGQLTAVRVRQCFPWSQPLRYFSLRDDDENEIALVSDLATLDPLSRDVLEDALAEAGFVMQVTSVLAIDEEVEIRHWHVVARQGERFFQTHLDEWPRVLPDGSRLIRDVSGDLYQLADPAQMDKRSRELLWAFID